MRIIAGAARRTTLEVAEGSSTRPFLEMARGALFNALGEAVTDAKVLDCYAGSGALGLEALSRGAASAVFVEADARAAAALRRNIAKCRMEDASVVTRTDVARHLAAETNRYHLIFLDPPFPDLGEWRDGGRAWRAMQDAARILLENGTLVFRLEDGKLPTPVWPDLRLVSDRRYGRSRVCRFTRMAAEGIES